MIGHMIEKILASQSQKWPNGLEFNYQCNHRPIIIPLYRQQYVRGGSHFKAELTQRPARESFRDNIRKQTNTVVMTMMDTLLPIIRPR